MLSVNNFHRVRSNTSMPLSKFFQHQTYENAVDRSKTSNKCNIFSEKLQFYRILCVSLIIFEEKTRHLCWSFHTVQLSKLFSVVFFLSSYSDILLHQCKLLKSSIPINVPYYIHSKMVRLSNYLRGILHFRSLLFLILLPFRTSFSSNRLFRPLRQKQAPLKPFVMSFVFVYLQF